MEDRLKVCFLLFEVYHYPGKFFTNKTIKKALLQMKNEPAFNEDHYQIFTLLLN